MRAKVGATGMQKGIRMIAAPLGAAVAVGGALVAGMAQAFASFDYANTFAPVSTDLQAAITAVVPIALGIFVIVLAIRLGARLVKNFTK